MLLLLQGDVHRLGLVIPGRAVLLLVAWFSLFGGAEAL